MGVLPVNYPLAPPSITLLTPNGRWEVGKKICLSNTSYHPDLWQPAWGIRTMMEALRSHFPVPGDGAIGSVDWPSDFRRKLAKESLDFISAPFNQRNRDLLPELTPEELQEDQPEPVPPDLRAPVLVDPALAPVQRPIRAARSSPANSRIFLRAGRARPSLQVRLQITPRGHRSRVHPSEVRRHRLLLPPLRMALMERHWPAAGTLRHRPQCLQAPRPAAPPLLRLLGDDVTVRERRGGRSSPYSSSFSSLPPTVGAGYLSSTTSSPLSCWPRSSSFLLTC